MIKALFFDIDGTLVSFQTHRIPESTVEAITAARKKGTKIFIATGRPKAIINNLSALDDSIIDGFITMNGAYCFVGNHVIYKSTVPPADVRMLARIAKEKGFPCIFVAEHEISVCQPSSLVDEIFHDYLHVDKLPVSSIEEAIQQDIYQMSPFITAAEEKEILSLMPNSEAGRWFPAFTDITAKGNTKQNGIDRIIRHFNLSLDETMAFGDGGNDIGMLRHASVGVAMGNANPEVQAVADYVTDTIDNDGIRKAMQHFKLI